MSDEDDCSVEGNTPFTVPDDGCRPRPPEMAPVDGYVSFLDDLEQERGRWAAAVIAGDSSCPSAFGDGGRLRELGVGAGANAIHRPICVPNLAGALRDAIDAIDTVAAACQTFPPID